MKITNKFGLPEALINALLNDGYSKGLADYSITELLSPPRQLALQKSYCDQIVEDASDLTFRLGGQAVAQVLHRANVSDISERRFFSTFFGKVISGQIDSLSLKTKTLTDWKVSTVYKFQTNQPPYHEFVEQLNMQLELLRRNGLDADKLQIVGFVRDFSPRASKLRPYSYPKSPTVIVDIPMWPRSQTVEFIESRIKMHESAKVELPECSKAERWGEDDIHAVMKGRRAIRGGLKSDHASAVEMHKEFPGSRIEFRPAVNKRCDGYCNVRQFCNQYLTLQRNFK